MWGELGDGSRTLRTVPARVAGLDHIVGIAAGYIHSMALGADGSVWAWGDNHYGQLGSGTTTESLRPLRLQGVSNVSAIAAGFYHSAAVVRTGRVLMWGQNTHGQLGDAVLRLRLVPVEVSAVRDADRIIGLIEADNKGPGQLILNRVKADMIRKGEMLSPDDVTDILAIKIIGIGAHENIPAKV